MRRQTSRTLSGGSRAGGHVGKAAQGQSVSNRLDKGCSMERPKITISRITETELNSPAPDSAPDIADLASITYKLAG